MRGTTLSESSRSHTQNKKTWAQNTIPRGKTARRQDGVRSLRHRAAPIIRGIPPWPTVAPVLETLTPHGSHLRIATLKRPRLHTHLPAPRVRANPAHSASLVPAACSGGSPGAMAHVLHRGSQCPISTQNQTNYRFSFMPVNSSRSHPAFRSKTTRPCHASDWRTRPEGVH
jgi:hypothetical protein